MIYDDLPEIHDDLCWEWWLIVDLPFKNMVISHGFLWTFTRPGKGQAMAGRRGTRAADEATMPKTVASKRPRPWDSDAARVAIDLGFWDMIWYDIYIYDIHTWH